MCLSSNASGNMIFIARVVEFHIVTLFFDSDRHLNSLHFFVQVLTYHFSVNRTN